MYKLQCQSVEAFLSSDQNSIQLSRPKDTWSILERKQLHSFSLNPLGFKVGTQNPPPLSDKETISCPMYVFKGKRKWSQTFDLTEASDWKHRPPYWTLFFWNNDKRWYTSKCGFVPGEWFSRTSSAPLLESNRRSMKLHNLVLNHFLWYCNLRVIPIN